MGELIGGEIMANIPNIDDLELKHVGEGGVMATAG